jgi:hypothetical protein
LELSYGTAVEEDGGERRVKNNYYYITLDIDGPSGPGKRIIWERAGAGARIRRERHIGHSESGIPIPLQNFIFNKFRGSHLITLLYTPLGVEGRLSGDCDRLCLFLRKRDLWDRESSHSTIFFFT